MFKNEAQELIEQLPNNNSKRNEWLVKNGVGEEAERLRVEKIIYDSSTTPMEKVEAIHRVYRGAPVTPRPYISPNMAPREGSW